MRMLLAAYRLRASEKLKLDQVFQTTISDSRRDRFERIASEKQIPVTEIDSLRESVQISLAESVRPPVLVKTHNAHISHSGFPLIRDELTLGAIYVVRNPLDLVDSIADHWGCSVDNAIGMLNNDRHTIGGGLDPMVSQYLKSWSKHVCSWIETPSFPTLIVRYEDLSASPQVTLQNVLTFLGWQIDSQRIHGAVAKAQFDQLRLQEETDGFSECSRNSTSGRFFRAGKAGNWTNILTDAQAAEVVANHGTVMTRLGYPSATASHHYSQSKREFFSGVVLRDF